MKLWSRYHSTKGLLSFKQYAINPVLVKLMAILVKFRHGKTRAKKKTVILRHRIFMVLSNSVLCAKTIEGHIAQE